MATRISRPGRKGNFIDHIDQLEARRLLASSLSGTTLVITGTTGKDTITVSFDSTTGQLRATHNGAASNFAANKVTTISVSANAGDDVVTLASNLPAGIKATDTDLGAGNDTFNGSNRHDTARGRAGNDTINGNSGDDNLYGDDGNDSISGGAGNSDRVYPGLGNDFASGGSGTFDTVTYQDRTDGVTVRIDGGGASGNTGAGESDTFASDFENAVGGDGNDRIIGNSGNNVIGGAGGNDTLDGGLGADQMWGDQGIDTITYASRSKRIVAKMDAGGGDGEAGEDDWIITSEILIGGSSHDLLVGDEFANTLIGGAGNDTLDGGSGNDSLQGDNGHDSLIGGNGRDRIRGGNHNDTVFGGNHADTIYGDAGNDTIDGGKLADLINGGAGTDSRTNDSTDRVSLVETTK